MLGLKLERRKDHDEKKDLEKDRKRVVGTSSEGFEDATAVAIKTAISALPKIERAEVKHMTVAVRDGKVVEYRVELKTREPDADD